MGGGISSCVTIKTQTAYLNQGKLANFNELTQGSRFFKMHIFSNNQVAAARAKIAGTNEGLVSLNSRPSHILVKMKKQQPEQTEQQQHEQQQHDVHDNF